MKTAICVEIGKDHIYKCDNVFIGRSGENESTQFQIKLEDSLCDSWVYIDFVKPDGSKYKTSRLDIVDNMVTYDIANELLTMNGTLKVQIVLQNEEGVIWKSTIKNYEIMQSIDATDDIPDKEDFITEAQNLLDEIEEGLTPTIGENGNWFVGSKDTGKPSRGVQGEKGEKGDAGSVRFIIVNELPTENIDDSAIYMKPRVTGEGENIYEEYVYVNGIWESLGSASVEVNLDDYVKNTDYATTNEAGVVKVSTSMGLKMNEDGSLYYLNANAAETQAKETTKRVLTPKYVDYIVKYGLTDNKLSWSEEEKANARELLGVGDSTNGTNSIVIKSITNYYLVSDIGSSGDTITWDGDTTDRPFEEMGDANYYKVSNKIPSPEELIGKTITISDATGSQLEEYVIASNDIHDIGNGFVMVLYNGKTLLMMLVSENEDANLNGTYFMRMELDANYSYISKLSLGGTGISIDTEGWSEAIQPMTPTNKYLWHYEKITYTDDTNFVSEPHIIGIYAATGDSSGGTGNLNYIGHYADKDSLPSIGQPSGVMLANIKEFADDGIFTGEDTSYKPSLFSGYRYIFGTYKMYREQSRYSIVATNFPEIIEGISLTTSQYNYYPAIKVNASPEKPVMIASYNTQGSRDCLYYPIENGVIGNQTYASNNTNVITQPCIVQLDLTGDFFGNLPNGIRFIYLPDSVHRGQTSADSITATYINPTYIYNDGMKLWTFNADTMTPEFYTGDFVDPLAAENNVASVGDDWIMYICDATPKWHRTGGYTKSEVDALIDGLRTELSEEILNPPTT